MTQLKTAIFIEQNFSTQDEVFHFLAEKAATEGFTNDEEEVYTALVKREKEGTTGMMNGFAIPHGKSTAITEPGILIVKLNQGIEWESMDGKPTNFILSMLIPEVQKGEGHLKILSQVARMLMKEDISNELKQATKAEEIEEIMNRQINF
ncbi:fructose PTS transporter subunit IIA [Jeotgalibaca sp. MA1X17-3]|uniref:PTS sugar transporter subunit IIA n=1 Tax=Jeotgalibaca sp. MA1X17-3 TaxID=2908211 RepID=UPI001F284522|nr:fructose PTS transporter subunit IIA [Jeotgalibaca sp. MA1X17-3]UJF15618.1 fructose PTS transporter subunit IIA [Jeotgalibaca sp. MA1X17-3]